MALLKERAPGAVKEYLEYLVFGKNVSTMLLSIRGIPYSQ
jgi:hypothetical protein